MKQKGKYLKNIPNTSTNRIFYEISYGLGNKKTYLCARLIPPPVDQGKWGWFNQVFF